MCGIVGYIGERDAQPILLASLSKLEYRGYDSCGIALADTGLSVFKDAVRVSELAASLPLLAGTAGIGHTRWATHGAPSKINAHPHTDCSGRIAIVHNGVINNYQKLRQLLINEGHVFTSETDTEIIAHLVEKYYQDDLRLALELALKDIEGSYAVIAIAEGKRELVVARKDSPLIMGIGDRENFIASDIAAVLDYTSRVIYLEDGDTGVVSADSIRISRNGQDVNRNEQKILWTPEQAQKGGYEHFMLKEIHEQPRVVRDTLAGYFSGDVPSFSSLNLNTDSRTIILACGTSYYAAAVGQHVIESLLGVPIRIEIASEFNYLDRCPVESIGIGLTQSGETLDTLKAMKRLKETGCRIIAITNVVGSTASRVADSTLYMRAGPEISVAATKTFTAELISLYWMAATSLPAVDRRHKELIMALRQLPGKVQEVLATKDTIISVAETLAGHENVFYIGRGINYPIAMEGALKMKEVAYIHSEAYSAGEIKHGPFALLSHSTPVVAVVATDNTHEAMLTNIKEIKARGAPVYAIADEDDDYINDLADIVLKVPKIDVLLSPFVNTVVVQLLAYYAAKKRGCPIDFPKNLAKSVTVE
jgi:glucosamine--fructose-6-phosphate aminotransferase (isomerizing)